MKNIILLILTLQIASIIKAQTFEKIIKDPQDNVVFDAAFIDESHVVFTYNSGDFEINYQAKVFKMNYYTGEIIDSLIIDFGFYEEYNLTVSQILPFHDTCFILFGNAENKSTGDKQLYICHINHQLEKTYDTLTGDTENNDNYYDYYINSNDHIIAAGSVIIESKYGERENNRYTLPIIIQHTPVKDYRKLLVTELNIWGEEIQRNVLNGPSNLGLSIIEIPGQNSYHFYLYSQSFAILNSETLEIASYTEYPSHFTPRMAFNGNSDTSSYVAGRYDPGTKEMNRNLSFLEIDQYGVIKNHYTYYTDSNILYSYKTFDVGSNHIYFGTNIPFDQPSLLQPRPRWILLYKLELNGEVIWQRFYNNGMVNYMPYRIMATPDGGALIFSTRYDWNDEYPYQRDIHILKIDSNGNYIPLGTEEPLKNDKQILVYPNPAKNKVNFSFGFYSKLKIDIYDLQGKKVFSKLYTHSPVIDLNSFSSGVYIYTISNQKGFFERGKLVVE